MTRINWARIVLCGLLAGVVINTFEFVLHYFMIDEKWLEVRGEPDSEALMSGGEIAALNLWGFLVGLLALWLYAAIRPRFGPGPRTAIYAGTAVWALAGLLATLKPAVGASLPMTATVTGAVVGLVEIVTGTLLGAWQYREVEAAAADAPDG